MGLDMRLVGVKSLMNPEMQIECDGLAVTELVVDIAYWRKHPNLHGYIVNTFAKGRDDCQEITVYREDVPDIIKAIKEYKLPHTEGFFFGTSRIGEEQIKQDVEVFEKALKWLESNPGSGYKHLVYRASW
jgi:hypothetical protein